MIQSQKFYIYCLIIKYYVNGIIIKYIGYTYDTYGKEKIELYKWMRDLLGLHKTQLLVYMVGGIVLV